MLTVRLISLEFQDDQSLLRATLPIRIIESQPCFNHTAEFGEYLLKLQGLSGSLFELHTQDDSFFHIRYDIDDQ